MAENRLCSATTEGETMYGVSVTDADATIRNYPFISSRKSEAERLLDRIQGADLSPLHVEDVVADYLLEIAYDRMKDNGIC